MRDGEDGGAEMGTGDRDYELPPELEMLGQGELPPGWQPPPEFGESPPRAQHKQCEYVFANLFLLRPARLMEIRMKLPDSYWFREYWNAAGGDVPPQERVDGDALTAETRRIGNATVHILVLPPPARLLEAYYLIAVATRRRHPSHRVFAIENSLSVDDGSVLGPSVMLIEFVPGARLNYGGPREMEEPPSVDEVLEWIGAVLDGKWPPGTRLAIPIGLRPPSLWSRLKAILGFGPPEDRAPTS